MVAAMACGVTIKRFIAGLTTLGLVTLTAWLLPYGWEQRHLFYKDYAFGTQAAERLVRHPEILYAYGREAEGRMDADGAAGYYGRVVAANPLHLDAWLRLAELRVAAGGLDEARRITTFCDRVAAPVVRWKWPETLLAHELDLPAIFTANVNFLIARRLKSDDALFLLETHTQADARRALAVLTPANRPVYLQWAMRWQRPDAAQAAWADIAAAGMVEDALVSDYVHFLLSRKQLQAAREIWQSHTGLTGMANAGFEAEPSGRGFDWIAASDGAGKWKVERAALQGRGGSAALRVRFTGRENIAFHHLRQTVPVVPQTEYRLRYWWKSQGLNTDQTPFVEVVGYDDPRLTARGAATPAGTHDWQTAEVVFSPPVDCHAVVVVLRRLPSRRFDSSIDGTLWVDDFELSPLTGSDRPPDPHSTVVADPTAGEIVVKASSR
jgi:hypothetical protein